MSEHHKAFYTVEESEVGNLYYFAPLTHAAGPFKEQRRVEAIIDIDADGCLAGVELIDKMPAPPKSPPMTAPADSRISDERLEKILAFYRPPHGDMVPPLVHDLVYALTELRERRAQAVTVVAWQFEEYYLARGGIGTWHTRFSQERPDEGRPDIRHIRPLAAAPPPAQAAGVTEEMVERGAKALFACVVGLTGAQVAEVWDDMAHDLRASYLSNARAALEASLSAQDREE